MQHLMVETIARLIDEAPTAEQAAHLERCDDCRATLEAMRADLAALRNLPMIEPPPTEWDQIEEKLLEEGLIRRRTGQSFWSAPAVRIAASVAVFAFGAFTGIAWTGNRNGSAAATEQVARTTSTTAPSLILATEPETPDQTLQLYRQAEALYLEMLTRVAALEEEEGGGDPVARLAALEGIATITRSALDQAPADPVLNGYHLTALAQREATIRQIAGSKPGRWF